MSFKEKRSNTADLPEAEDKKGLNNKSFVFKMGPANVTS